MDNLWHAYNEPINFYSASHLFDWLNFFFSKQIRTILETKYIYHWDFLINFLTHSSSTLKSMAMEFLGDKSEKGVWMSNMFNEYLGNTGTSASAMVVKDLIMTKKFANDRDAARILTSIPFSIRRPNKQLVEEFEALLNWNDAER